MGEWFSIEVLHGPTPTISWIDAYGDELVTAAFGEGATDWATHRHPWGVVLEIEFPDESAFERYRLLPVVVAALDNVPDPINGLLVQRGRGGSSGSRHPNRPRPFQGSGSVALPIPEDLAAWDDETEQIRVAEQRILVEPRSHLA